MEIIKVLSLYICYSSCLLVCVLNSISVKGIWCQVSRKGSCLQISYYSGSPKQVCSVITTCNWRFLNADLNQQHVNFEILFSCSWFILKVRKIFVFYCKSWWWNKMGEILHWCVIQTRTSESSFHPGPYRGIYCR